MRHNVLAFMTGVTTLVGGVAGANESVERLCTVAFQAETLPKREQALFCECVASEAGPRLSSHQDSLLRSVAGGLRSGSSILSSDLLDQLADSGIRDIIIEAQARCSDALYQTSDQITLKSADGAELLFYCDLDRIVPAAAFRKSNLQLASETEIAESLDAIIMGTANGSAYPVVEITWRVDGGAPTTEYWDVNLAGDGADSDVAGKILRDARFADRLTVQATRGNVEYVGTFIVSKKIPVTWQPCPVR